MSSENVIYTLVAIFSIPFGCYYRTIKDKNLRKNIGTCVGFVMILLVSGIHCLHLFVTVLINVMVISKINEKHRYMMSFIFSFSYLAFLRSTIYFGIPYPPAPTRLYHMMLTLKLVALVNEINSSQVNLAKNQEEKDKNDMTKVEVDNMDIIHYCFNVVGILSGPYCKYRTFIDYFNYPFAEHAEWKRAALKKFRFVPLYFLILLSVNYIWPVTYVTTDEFYQRSWWYRYWYMWPIVVVFVMKMLTGFVLYSIFCILTGFGAYPSFTNPKPGLGPSEKFSEMKQLLSDETRLSTVEYSFETVNNFNEYEALSCTTFRELTWHWNCSVQYWLTSNVYQKFPFKSYRKAATMFISAFWHGTHAGYYLSLGLVPFVFMIEDIYVKLYRKTAGRRSLKVCEWMNWFYKMHCFTYMAVAFILLEVDLVLKYYNSIYHVGSVSGIILYVVGLFLLNMKATK